MVIFMEAIPLRLLPYKPHLFSVTQHRLILIQNKPLHLCCTFRPVVRPSSCMSIQNSKRIPSIFKDESTGSCICLRSLIYMSHVNKVQPIRVKMIHIAAIRVNFCLLLLSNGISVGIGHTCNTMRVYHDTIITCATADSFCSLFPYPPHNPRSHTCAYVTPMTVNGPGVTSRMVRCGAQGRTK
jgi:hypothetical protein